VLDKNFPNSAYASGGANRKKPWYQLW